MSIIKGLIIKDLLQLKSYKKNLFIFLIIFSFLSLTNGVEGNVGNMIILAFTLGLSMFGMASFSYDEMSKTDRYIVTLPVNRKQIVLSKYILIICATIIGSLIGFLLNTVITFIISKQLLDVKEQLYFLLAGILGIGFVEAIQIPCIYKYGAEKGRVFIFFIIFIIAFLAGGITYLWGIFNINIKINFDNINYILNNYLPIVLIFIIAVIYWISYKISLKIYSKKEI